MKKILILIASVVFFSQQVWAGACSCVCGPCCRECFSGPSTTSSYSKSTGISKNAAYFNTKDAAVRISPNVLATSRSSAISITEADFLTVVQPNMRQETRTTDNATVQMNIGIDDRTNPQTWTLPTNFLSNFPIKRRVDFIAAAAVPIAAQVAGATHVSKETYVDPKDGHTLVEYAHYQLNAGQQFNELGTTFIDVTDNIVADFGEAAELYADVPLDLNDAFTNHLTDYEDDSDLPKIVRTNDVTVDGFGTINNPFGAGVLNCLRLSIVKMDKEYTTNPITPSNTTTQYYVGWVTKEGFRFYAKKTSANPTPDPITGKVTLSSMEITHFFPSPVLAVELLDFQGVATNKSVDLTWITASEKDNNYYQIERSKDGKTFEKIGQVKGNGTTMVKHSYNFLDLSPPLGVGGYYRLRQVDFDGTSTTSNIISVAPSANKEKIQVYPNPAQNSLTIASHQGVDNAQNSANFLIINVLGQEILRGSVNQAVDISALPRGSYVVKVGLEQTTFVKQ